jgi:hypothetical protein
MRTSAQTALETLINEEDVVRTDAGKRGDQYRHCRPEEDSAETMSVSGRKILDKDEAGGFFLPKPPPIGTAERELMT